MVGATLVLGAGTWFIASDLSDENLDTQYSIPQGKATRDGSLFVTLLAGESVRLDEAKIQLTIDGSTGEYPLSVFAGSVADGNTWKAGEQLCIIGKNADCLVLSGHEVSAQIVVVDTLIWQGEWIVNPWSVNENGLLQSSCAGPVSVHVLGTSITYGSGGPDIPVRVDLDDGDGFSVLFGNDPVSGGETYEIAWAGVGTEFRVQGRASFLNFYASYASGAGDGHVLTLLDGDEVPDIPAYGDQDDIESFLAPYIDVASGTVSLSSSEAILLFEFTSNLNSSAADWQDLVVLVDFEGPLCNA